MRRSCRPDRYVPMLRRLAGELSGCRVTVRWEPGYEMRHFYFVLRDEVPGQDMDALVLRVLHALGDWCRARNVVPNFLVVWGDYAEQIGRRYRAPSRRRPPGLVRSR